MVAKEDDNINRNANNEKRDSDGQISVNRHSIISDSSKSRVKNHHKKVHFQLGFQRFYNLVGLLQFAKTWNKKHEETILPVANPEPIQPSPEAQNKEKFDFYKWSEKYVIDPSQNLYYKWLIVISLAVMYNLIFIIARTSFDLLQNASLATWLCLDYFCDLIYLFDMFVRFRTGYLDNGLLERDSKKLAKHYIKSLEFKLDTASLIPLELIAIFVENIQVKCRFNRLLRINRIFEFRMKSETTSSSPYLFRIVFLLLIIIISIHWNGCIYYLISQSIGIGTDSWVINETVEAQGLFYQYTFSYLWAAFLLTNIGEVNPPENDIETVVMIVNFLIGIILFASIIGNIGSMIENLNIESDEFQNKVDSVKEFMKMRKVSLELYQRIIKWFIYLWDNKQRENKDEISEILSNRLSTEVAVDAHLSTIKKVNIFSDCENSFLEELVTKLKLQVYSPGEFVCRKGDIGKEMYIIKKGKLNVVNDDGSVVFVTLKDGAYFGELSILNIPGNKTGNRRTANVKSLGYSDLFCLRKVDLWEALKEYPQTKEALIEKGKQMLRKDNLLIEDEANEGSEFKEIDKNYHELSSKQKLEIVESIYEHLAKKIEIIADEINKNMQAINKEIADLEQSVV